MFSMLKITGSLLHQLSAIRSLLFWDCSPLLTLLKVSLLFGKRLSGRLGERRGEIQTQDLNAALRKFSDKVKIVNVFSKGLQWRMILCDPKFSVRWPTGRVVTWRDSNTASVSRKPFIGRLVTGSRGRNGLWCSEDPRDSLCPGTREQKGLF